MWNGVKSERKRKKEQRKQIKVYTVSGITSDYWAYIHYKYIYIYYYIKKIYKKRVEVREKKLVEQNGNDSR